MSSLLIHKIGNSFFHVDSLLTEFPMFLGDFWADIENDKFQLNRYAGSSGREYNFTDVTIQVDSGSIENFTAREDLTNRLKEISYPGIKNFSSGGATPSLPQVLAVGDREMFILDSSVTDYTFTLQDRTRDVYTDSDCNFILDGSLIFPNNSVLSFNTISVPKLTVTNSAIIYFNGKIIDSSITFPTYGNVTMKCTSDGVSIVWFINSNNDFRTIEIIGNSETYTFNLTDRSTNKLGNSNATFVLDGNVAFPENSVLMFSCPIGTNTLSFINGTTIYFNGAVLTTDLVMPSFSKGYLTCTDAPAKTWILTYEVGSGLNGNYSTDEINTGTTWIDGKPIFRKVLTGSSVGASDIGVDSTIENIIKCDVKFIDASHTIKFNASVYFAIDLRVQTLVSVSPPTDDGLISIAYVNYALDNSVINFIPFNYTIIFEYTKTT